MPNVGTIGDKNMSHALTKKLETYFDRLWPIARSIAGPGFRESLKIISEIAPFKEIKFASGSQVFDWTVPKEWQAKEAYFIDPTGRRWADFKVNNLHLLGYSVPFKGKVRLDELKSHLYTLPNLPEAIPYVTSYYKERWGFCLSHKDYESLPPGEYEVVVDTEFKDGHVVSGEIILPGTSKEEVVFSSYLCHPSLANNELSGPLVLSALYEKVAAMKNRRFTYRFVMNAETIGTICYLSHCGDALKKNMIAGYVITCVGDRGDLSYKESRRGGTLADRVAMRVLRERQKMGREPRVHPFDPTNGSEERQYCSPGFDLPFGSLMRTMYSMYPEYHSSLDNKDLVSFDAMAESVDAYFDVVKAIENNHTWQTTCPYGEPQLSKRNLYPTVTVKEHNEDRTKAILWLVNLADGLHDLVAIAERSDLNLALLYKTAMDLEKEGLLKKI